jgi:hypothetical protein
MSVSNHDVIQALYNLFKDGKLSGPVFQFALKSPKTLVDLYNPQPDADTKVVEVTAENYYDGNKTDVSAYMASGWKKKIINLWNASRKVEAIKLTRVVASHSKNKVFPFDATINEVADIKGSGSASALCNLGLADSKVITEHICGANF